MKNQDIIKKINTIVFDKTGTLTAGRPLVKDFICCFDKFKAQQAWKDMDKLMNLLYLAEQNSDHPIAMAIRVSVQSRINKESSQNMKVMRSKNYDGQGIEVEM